MSLTATPPALPRSVACASLHHSSSVNPIVDQSHPVRCLPRECSPRSLAATLPSSGAPFHPSLHPPLPLLPFTPPPLHRQVSKLTVAANSSIGEACRLIEDRGIKRLPVVQNGELIGIIARADLVRALAQDIERAAAATTPDVSVNERLRELERQNLRNRARGRTSKPY